MRKIYLLTFFSFIAYINCCAQNNTSPYSMAGIGDMESGYMDRTTGTANTGVALSSNRFMYNINPASYAALNDHSFLFEISARYKGVLYSGAPITSFNDNKSSADLQFKKITFAIKPKPRWGLSFGLLPFSNSNYSFSATKYIAGLPAGLPAYYEGTGNINQVYVANSFKLTKNLLVGVQSSFVFGQQEQQETLNAGLIDSTLVTTYNLYYSNFYFKGGIQYHAKLSSKWAVSLGATGSLQTKLREQTNVQVQEGNSFDTVNNISNYPDKYFKLPLMYTGGIAASFKDKFTFVADYNRQLWSNLNYLGIGYNLTNSSRYSVGFEYSKKTMYRDYLFERYFLQAGAYYSQSYLVMNGKQINDVGFTLGYGKNLTNGLGLQLAMQLGQRGTASNGLIREDYMQITLTLGFGEIWVSKRRYN